jgi:hypothetical protein
MRSGQVTLCGLLTAAALCAGGSVPGQEKGKAQAQNADIALAFDQRGVQGKLKPTMQVGIGILKDAVPGLPLKRLTYFPEPQDPLPSGNTCVRLDGKELIIGLDEGKWDPMSAKLDKGLTGLRSVWVYPDVKVRVTQTAEVVRGEQTGRVDTCRVTFRIENKDDHEHTVGLRYLLDTYVGTNDGAPFIIPGQKALCETMKDIRGADKVPAFVQALESPKLDFKKPGVVAHLRLKLGGGLEDPSRVSFGAWPMPNEAEPEAKGSQTKWNVPVFSMRTGERPDGAAVIYWDPRKVPAGGHREMGFTYGLGHFRASKDGKLGLILAGSFRAGGDMTVLALVRDPQEGQSLKLKLPEELKLAGGEATQKVARPGEAAVHKVSPVTWTVQTPEEGTVEFEISASTGETLTQRVRINQAAEKKNGDE